VCLRHIRLLNSTLSVSPADCHLSLYTRARLWGFACRGAACRSRPYPMHRRYLIVCKANTSRLQPLHFFMHKVRLTKKDHPIRSGLCEAFASFIILYLHNNLFSGRAMPAPTENLSPPSDEGGGLRSKTEGEKSRRRLFNRRGGSLRPPAYQFIT